MLSLRLAIPSQSLFVADASLYGELIHFKILGYAHVFFHEIFCNLVSTNKFRKNMKQLT